MTADRIAGELRVHAIQLLAVADMLDPPNEVARELAPRHLHEYDPETRQCIHCGRTKPGRRPRPQIQVQTPQKAQEMRLHILSSTRPTEQELEDREVAHVTEEPA